MPKDNSDRPDTPSLSVEAQRRHLRLVRDVYAGTDRLRDKKETYLPRFPLETADGYETRRKAAVLFNAFKRTVNGLVGMPFRKPLELGDDVPVTIAGNPDNEPPIVGHAENIDLAGRHIDVFARDLLENGFIDGHGVIFVDMQTVDTEEPLSVGEERQLGLRPYWVMVPKGDVVRAQTATINGRSVLTHFAYVERTVEKKDGARFEEVEVVRVRDYRLVYDESADRVRVVYELFRQVEEKDGEWVSEGTGVLTIDEIPAVAAYTNRTGYFESEPLLLDLAYENIRHYQIRSDRDNTLHIAGVPIPWFAGLAEDAKIGVGSDMGIRLPEGGSADYLEPTGVALSSTRDELKDIEARMARLGLSMLMSDSRAAETAMSKRIDKSESDSQLAAAVRGLRDALEEALRLHAKWMVAEGERTEQITGGTVAVNTDFVDEPMSPETARVLLDLVKSGQLSVETMWDALAQGELLPEGFDADTERERLNEQAIADVARFVTDTEPEPGREVGDEPEPEQDEAA